MIDTYHIISPWPITASGENDHSDRVASKTRMTERCQPGPTPNPDVSTSGEQRPQCMHAAVRRRDMQRGAAAVVGGRERIQCERLYDTRQRRQHSRHVGSVTRRPCACAVQRRAAVAVAVPNGAHPRGIEQCSEGVIAVHRRCEEGAVASSVG